MARAGRRIAEAGEPFQIFEDSIMKELAPLLDYGLTGLAAILALLSYRLLLKESDKKTPRKTMLAAIKSFAVLCVVLALISGASNAFETFFLPKLF